MSDLLAFFWNERYLCYGNLGQWLWLSHNCRIMMFWSLNFTAPAKNLLVFHRFGIWRDQNYQLATCWRWRHQDGGRGIKFSLQRAVWIDHKSITSCTPDTANHCHHCRGALQSTRHHQQIRGALEEWGSLLKWIIPDWWAAASECHIALISWLSTPTSQ